MSSSNLHRSMSKSNLANRITTPPTTTSQTTGEASLNLTTSPNQPIIPPSISNIYATANVSPPTDEVIPTHLIVEALRTNQAFADLLGFFTRYHAMEAQVASLKAEVERKDGMIAQLEEALRDLTGKIFEATGGQPGEEELRGRRPQRSSSMRANAGSCRSSGEEMELDAQTEIQARLDGLEARIKAQRQQQRRSLG